jgi:hypothetical protein
VFAEQEGGARWSELQQVLERTIECQVRQRTWERIQGLEVRVSRSLVVVRGRAPSYYVEQLALQGVLDVIESAGPMRIELSIQVGSSQHQAGRSTDEEERDEDEYCTPG